MANYRFLTDAFWENSEKTKLKCIRITDLPEGKEKKDILSLDKFLPNGSPNKKFEEAVHKITLAEIDKFTQERINKKKGGKDKSENKKVIENSREKKRVYEDLFNQKLKAFEIDEIKNCENKNLRARLRRAKNEIELSAVAALIIGVEMGLLKNE